MKNYLGALVWMLVACAFVKADGPYWLLQEDFIKLGRREVYEKQVLDSFAPLQKDIRHFQAYLLEDLENPQYGIVYPIYEKHSWLEYPPFFENQSPLLQGCLHFQIFSLHKTLFMSDKPFVFGPEKPYLAYVICDVIPGSEALFEKHMEKKLKDSNVHSWQMWKTLFGADIPKYIIWGAFATKDEISSANLSSLAQEASIKEILRNRKQGTVLYRSYIKN